MVTTNSFQSCHLLVWLGSLLILCAKCVSSSNSVFLVSPGDGNEFVYSPVDVNATLHCAVNNTDLSWDIDMLSFDNSVERLRLHSRGIFQTEPVTSSVGVTTSSVSVLGRVPVNNNSRICCQTVVNDRELHVNCTTLIFCDIFLISPGDGKEFVYSPVDANATLHCAVNNIDLSWDVGMRTFDNSAERLRLHSRGIFQTEPVTSSAGVTTSSVTILGSVPVNNNSRICCQSVIDEREILDNCTTLILYDRPAPLDNVRVDREHSSEATMLNISWRATKVTGVIQNYTVYFKSHKVETTQLYYIYQLDMLTTKCGEFLAFITAVNEAGESDPSNNVTIPSLPDIGPVTASLSHQVWKSADGEIMTNVSFKSARYCNEYPLLGYTLMLRSVQTSVLLDIPLNSTETKVVIGPQEGLLDNQRYEYAVSALNSFGIATSHENGKWKSFFTSEVQSVIATVVRESTIDIQCLFIHGSDAVGCKVVLHSDCSNVTDKRVILHRSNKSAVGHLSFGRNIPCYHQMLAYVIDSNNSFSDFFIEGTIKQQPISEDNGEAQIPIIVIVPIGLLSILIVVAIILIIILLLKKKKHVDDLSSERISTSNRDNEGIQTTPNEVYGISTEGIQTTPNEVYGVSSGGKTASVGINFMILK